MKVVDIMSRQVEYVFSDTKLRDVAKLIFGRSINGVPVVDNKKRIVGFITEKDILAKFYPSMQEYVEDPFHSSDFEGMEKRVDEVLDMTAEQIMSKNPTVVMPSTPLLRAQSLMFIEKVGRLPVVDKEGKLIGILSKGDIFRALVGQKLPFEEDEQFHDWLSSQYDVITDQQTRLSKEIPDLVKLFKELNIKTILDIGCGTGIHSIALAQEGFEVTGLDRSSRMVYVAGKKILSLPDSIKKRVKFINKDYRNLSVLRKKFDVAIFMGSAIAHVDNPQKVLEEVSEVLNDKALVICQITNYDKIINTNKRFFDFCIRKPSDLGYREQAFLKFFDEKENGFLTQNIGVFIRGSKKWGFKGIHSMSVYPINKENITEFLKKINFLDIKYYGGEKGFFYDYLFSKPFSKTQSDVLVVVAKR